MSKNNKYSKYEILIQGFHTRLDSLEHLNQILPKLYLSYNESELNKLLQTHKITKEEDKQISEIIKSVKEKDGTIQSKISQLSGSTLSFFGDYMKNYLYKRTMEKFEREMSIIYLITVFEEFLKNVLKTVFLTKNEILKSTKNMTYEEIIDLKSYDAIIEKMTEKKVQDIIDKDIVDLGKTLLEDFGFPIINDQDWKSFIEVYYRRHVLVHNNGIPDERYRIKTGIEVYSELTTTEDYVKQTLSLFKKFSIKIKDFFSSKYPSFTDGIS